MHNKLKFIFVLAIATGLNNCNLNSTVAGECVELKYNEVGCYDYNTEIILHDGSTAPEIIEKLKEATIHQTLFGYKVIITLATHQCESLYAAATKNPVLASTVDAIQVNRNYNFYISPTIGLFTRLTHIVSETPQSTLPEEIGMLPRLCSLVLRGQNLKYFPDTLRKKICSHGSSFFMDINSSDATYCDLNENNQPVHMIKFKNGPPGVILCATIMRKINCIHPNEEVAKNIATSQGLAKSFTVESATRKMISKIAPEETYKKESTVEQAYNKKHGIVDINNPFSCIHYVEPDTRLERIK
ncbi:hypothetical protein HOD08_02865 [bacterium]|nr:hypothetical protein [bacterium]